jgi:uncharacterized Zn-binding protein involved in type VI secretion
MPAVARVGDSISHGGSITGGSPTTVVDDLALARLGDPVHCVVHGAQTISGPCSPTTQADGLRVARVGDGVSCGATITTGSPTTRADG